MPKAEILPKVEIPEPDAVSYRVEDEVRPKHCYKCIHLDVKMQQYKITIEVQRKKIAELQAINKQQQKIIHRLRKEKAAKYNELKRCLVCRELFDSYEDDSHICNGDAQIECEYCELSFHSTSSLIEHLSIFHNEKNFHKCEKCSIVYSMAILLEFHKKRHNADGPKYICDVCDEKCYTYHEICDHMRQNHGNQSKMEEMLHFQCGTCGKRFANENGLKKHTTKMHEKYAFGKFECFLCKKMLKSLHQTRIHLQSHVRDEKCTVCSELWTPNELEEHMCHGLKSVKCVYCRKPHKIMKQLLQHLEICKGHEQSVYRCDVCKKNFRMEMLRNYHLKHHEKHPKIYLCDICPKRFSTPSLLSVHKKSHSSIKAHLCDQCGKEFANPRNLQLHQIIHGQEKKFKCSKCDLRFMTEEYLRRHSLRHQNVKYICSICNQSLVSQRGLVIHMSKLNIFL